MFVWYPPTMPAKPGTLIVKGMNGPDIRYPSLPSTIVIEPRKSYIWITVIGMKFVI